MRLFGLLVFVECFLVVGLLVYSNGGGGSGGAAQIDEQAVAYTRSTSMPSR